MRGVADLTVLEWPKTVRLFTAYRARLDGLNARPVPLGGGRLVSWTT